jgi:hypothetical protein
MYFDSRERGCFWAFTAAVKFILGAGLCGGIVFFLSRNIVAAGIVGLCGGIVAYFEHRVRWRGMLRSDIDAGSSAKLDALGFVIALAGGIGYVHTHNIVLLLATSAVCGILAYYGERNWWRGFLRTESEVLNLLIAALFTGGMFFLIIFSIAYEE